MVVWARSVQDSVGGLPSCDRNAKLSSFIKCGKLLDQRRKYYLPKKGKLLWRLFGCQTIHVRLSCYHVLLFQLSSLPILNNRIRLYLFKSNIGCRNHSRSRAFWSVTSISVRNNLKPRCQNHLCSKQFAFIKTLMRKNVNITALIKDMPVTGQI